MASPHPKHTFRYPGKLALLALLTSILFQACDHEKKIYKSDCNINKTFKRTTFKHLMDSIDTYDQKYVEISGKYLEDKELSALFNDSLFVDHSEENALWVDFSQECPLYLTGTRQGLFEYNDGSFTRLNNKAITIRGLIDVHNKGHLKKYKAAIERVSLVKL